MFIGSNTICLVESEIFFFFWVFRDLSFLLLLSPSGVCWILFVMSFLFLFVYLSPFYLYILHFL